MWLCDRYIGDPYSCEGNYALQVFVIEQAAQDPQLP
jgi:hypothetical protein